MYMYMYMYSRTLPWKRTHTAKAHNLAHTMPKRRHDDSDDDDWRYLDEPELPNMSYKPVHTTGSASSSATASLMPSHEPWQRVLLQLLGKPGSHRAVLERRGSILCPFTRRGLSVLYTASPELYSKFHSTSGCNVPADPTSPHMQQGHAYCTCGNEMNFARLEQHCGPQPSGKTAAIDGVAPKLSDVQGWERFSYDEQLHYVLRMWLAGKEELAPAPKAERNEPQAKMAEIVWPPMLDVDFSPTCGINYSAQGKLRQTFPDISHGYPVWEEGGFQHRAVLAFASAGDDHAKGYAMAMACLEETKLQIAAAAPSATADGILRMELCTHEGDYSAWTRQIDRAKARQSHKSQWCDGILRQHKITFVKRYEKAQQLAKQREVQRMEAEEQAKMLEEERAQRAQAEAAKVEAEAARAQEREKATGLMAERDAALMGMKQAQAQAQQVWLVGNRTCACSEGLRKASCCRCSCTPTWCVRSDGDACAHTAVT